jgi:hypothetical protein
MTKDNMVRREAIEATSRFKLPSYTVVNANAITGRETGEMVYITNETGGAVPAFFDGTNWRRVTDRSIIA